MTAQSVITFCMKATLDNIIMMNQENKLENLLNPKYTYMAIFIMKDSLNYDIYYRASQQFKFCIFGDCIGQKNCTHYFESETIKKELNFVYQKNDIILAKMNFCENDFLCEKKSNISKIKYIPYNITSYDDFIKFISLNQMPLVHNLTDYNYEIMTKNKFNSLIYIKGEKEQKSNKEIGTILQNILEQKKYGITWGSILDPLNSANDYETTKLFSIEVEDYKDNGLVIIHSPDKILEGFNIYRLNTSTKDNINEEIIQRFINEFNSGIIKRDIKSELIPKFHPKKNLRMVVGKTFNQEILGNNNKTIILILLTLDTKNLHKIENQIESLTIKFMLYNESLIFNFLDPALNEMPNMPNYNINEKPFYRYYYKNKKKKFIDFKGNSLEQSEIEDWIIDNYGKEYGIEYKYGMRMHIDGMTELLKDENVFKEYERKQKYEQMMEDFGVKINNFDNINNTNNINKETDL